MRRRLDRAARLRRQAWYVNETRALESVASEHSWSACSGLLVG